MPNSKLSKEDVEDLIRIHQYGINKFGQIQADKYFEKLFKCFEVIAERPYSFEAVEYIRKGY